ncbi:MAG: EscU/YscU/HrcU family type III secretion system export apparatus switch protein [Pirellulaceae bacterium]|nr:EscU/YscU/HrcU family type III secretion system export apparatus switch protein [Pirellulaceae bacterium]
MAESSADKKHSATQRRRQRAREAGQVARSQDLSSAVLLLAALGTLWFFGGHAAEHLAAALVDGISETQIQPLAIEDASHTLTRSTGRLAIAALPVLIAMMITGVLINITQTGFLLLPAKLVPSLQNINPVTGAQRIASLPALARLGFGLVKVAAVATVSYGALRHYGDRVMNLAALEVPQIARTLFDCLMGTCVAIGGALFVLALADYAFQRWKNERDLMMTDEELKQELRETEGNPEVKNRRKQLWRTGSITADRSAVLSADVVVTSESGVAIAMQYNPMTMAAPVIVAKGSGDTADAIQSAADRNGIPVTERSLLAEHQFRYMDVGAEIPAQQYQAVADVLRSTPTAGQSRAAA